MLDLQEAFPDPKGMLDELHGKGFKGIWMLDPGIKAEEGYGAYDSGCEEDVWVLSANGKPYVGKHFRQFWFDYTYLLVALFNDSG